MDTSGDPETDPTDEAVVSVAADAAESLVLSRLDRADIEDLDITIRFEDAVLEVDVYLNAPTEDAEQVAEDAALAARGAVDELFDER